MIRDDSGIGAGQQKDQPWEGWGFEPLGISPTSGEERGAGDRVQSHGH